MRLRGVGYAFAGTLMFGLGVVLANIIGREITGALVALLALGIGGLLLSIALLFTKASLLKTVTAFDWHSWLHLVALAGLGTALPLLLIVAGFSRTSALEGGFLLQLNGVAALVFAVLFLHERVFLKQGMGISLLLIGSVLVVFSGAGTGAGKNDLVGDGLIFLGAIGLGFGYIPAKQLANQADTLSLTALRLLVGAILVLPVLGLQLLLARSTLLWHPAGTTLLIALPIYILTNFCLAYLAQQDSLRLLDAWEVAAIMQTVPVFSTLFAVILLHNTLTFWQAIGGGLALLGGISVSVSNRASSATTKEESILPQEVRRS